MTKPMMISVVAFVLIIAGMFGYAQYKKSHVASEAVSLPTSAQLGEQDSRYDYITRVDAKHFFIDGVHTLAGELLMPTPCDLLEVNALVAESYPEQVSVAFNVINNAEFCSQTQTSQRFKVSATASEEATFSAKFMDRNIDLNLIPAAEGETPDEFELFIKG